MPAPLRIKNSIADFPQTIKFEQFAARADEPLAGLRHGEPVGASVTLWKCPLSAALGDVGRIGGSKTRPGEAGEIRLTACHFVCFDGESDQRAV
jgi:hypothetical protein